MTYYNDLMNKANKLADGIVTFTNSSWHNDACGSIMFELGKGDENYIQLFAFETEEEMKAEGFEDMFCVNWVERGDWDETKMLLTNDEGEAIAHAVKLAKEMQDDQDVLDYEQWCRDSGDPHYGDPESVEGFEWQGIWIEDRTKSPCGRFGLTPEQSHAVYGKQDEWEEDQVCRNGKPIRDCVCC